MSARERLSGYPTTEKMRSFEWDFRQGVDRYETWEEIEVGAGGVGARVFRVEEEDVLAFNLAALETDPAMVDLEYARAHDGLVAHPLFLVQIAFWCIDVGIGSWIRSPGARNPGQLIELYEPIRVGEEISVTVTHVDKWIRRGNHYMQDRVDFHNERGDHKGRWLCSLLLPATRAELERWASA
jgi:acyl dehydratase